MVPVQQNNHNNTNQYHCTYEELKWNDKPLYCPDDLVLQDISHDWKEIVPVTTDEEICTTTATECPPPRIPIHAGKTALLIVDVQPEYWSSCPSVRMDFPHFEENLARTIDMARKQRAKIIWVRADYRKHHSPWLIQFERLNRGQRPDTIVELPCDPDSDEFKWEHFATPGECIIFSFENYLFYMEIQSKPTPLYYPYSCIHRRRRGHNCKVILVLYNQYSTHGHPPCICHRHRPCLWTHHIRLCATFCLWCL